MSRSCAFLAASLLACAACSSSSGTGGSTGGSGGAMTSTPASSTAGTGGGDAGACNDPYNPMFGSCVVPFLAGCWAPDLSGTCTDTGGVVSWSDGSKYVTQGSMTGLYAPGDATPCISMVIAQGSITGTKGTQVLHFQADSATQTATIGCPDGTTFTATDAQVTAFNVCYGLNCP